MWYDKSRMLSHNKLLNFVLSNRGAGKTYDCKKWCISDYLKTGAEFVWLRRYKTEIDKEMLETFFKDIYELFPDVTLEVKGKQIYINGNIAGYIVPLSTALKKKSVPYPKVNKIIFDEFIITKSTFHYLPNEPDLYLDFFETVARLRDNVRGVFLGNAISIVNPYFLSWKIHPDTKKRFTVTDHVVVEIFKDAEFIEIKKRTKYGQFVEGTNYGAYAIDNRFLLDNETFVKTKPPESEFMLYIRYNGNNYGFWVDYKEGLIFVNNQYDPSTYNAYCITKEDHQPNLLLIKSLATCKPIQRIIYAFQNGLIRFSNMEVKNQFYEFIHFFVR